ncbi:transcriptional repressor [Oxynema sp. CENA135]|jgi:Fur family ferric uptake transcriptional regulator|uniref:Transcriptional repressor n=1 Tax=Oxynema aestuarii AP17 TaxID=2064643 RepID=A0A6H1TVA2_9CYAN|nr:MULTISPECIES: transcriptional repressor [Oxynema]MBK4730490.1 transcriptional repressor [Oxynema sp. CENA135]QIZ69259.1 transcriptional repressor [Oxynema aestuarii AP17]RMH75823.1 MAG: transcriptional repressor [Cyanobacteria bacterium J007]
MSIYNAAALKAELRQRGFRMTAQRETILRVFQTIPQGKHLNAEELYNILQHQGEKISVSTVYRTLNLMAKMGILRELEFAEGHKHYELNKPSELHHHLICVECRQTVEFKSDWIAKIAKNQAKSNEFELLDCQLTLHCVCLEAFEEGWPYCLPEDWVCPKSQRHRSSCEPH